MAVDRRGGTQSLAKTDARDVNQGVHIQVVLRARPPLHDLHLGCREVEQGGDEKSRTRHSLGILYTIQREPAEERNADRSVTIDQTRQRVLRSLHHLGTVEIGYLGKQALAVQWFRREETEVLRLAMREPQRQRRAAVKDEPGRRQTQLGPEEPLRPRERA